MSDILITGNSAGLGLGLTKHYLGEGKNVYGCSRRGCPLQHGHLHDRQIDLGDFESIAPGLQDLLGNIRELELVVLNAGVLGRTALIHTVDIAEMRQVMDINLWSNKVILDWLLAQRVRVTQIVLVSSGASVLGNKGWNAYALSKAALNMLARLYAHEFEDTHISAIAPGLIDSAMMDYLCVEPSTQDFPALQRLRDARGTDAMPSPDEAARRVAALTERFRDFPSGSYLDIREL